MQSARDGCIIGVKLKPGASREKVVSVGADEAIIAVTAPPVDGKANESLIKLLAQKLDRPKSSISIRRGAASRMKLVVIAGMTKTEVMERLKKQVDG